MSSSWRHSHDAHLTRLAPLRARAAECRLLPGRFPNLQALHFTRCNPLTDAAVCALARGPPDPCSPSVGSPALLHLRCLHAACVDGVDARTWRALASLPALRELTLAAPAPASSSVQRCKPWPSGILDAHLRALGELTALEVLSLGACDQVTDAGALELGRLSRLQHLHLEASRKLTDAGAVGLAALPSLRSLHLSQGSGLVSDAGVRALARMPQLRELTLGLRECVTGEAVRALARAPALQVLALGLAAANESVAEDLVCLRHCLTSLNLNNCSRMKDSTVASLAAASLAITCLDLGCEHVSPRHCQSGHNALEFVLMGDACSERLVC